MCTVRENNDETENLIGFYQIIHLADQQFILKKSPALLQEMINVICQLIIMARSREGKEKSYYIVFKLVNFTLHWSIL